MIKNICKILVRSLDISGDIFTEIAIAKSGGSLEISDEYTPAGKLYNFMLRAVPVQAAFYRADGLQFAVHLSDNTCVLLGNDDLPAFLKTSENTDGAALTVEWKNWEAPVFMPLA